MSVTLPARAAPEPRVYRGGYLIGFLLLAVAVLRALIFYQGRPQLAIAMLLITGYGLLYTIEPLLTSRVRWFRVLYFPLQTALLLVFTNLRPFLDNSCALYIPLWVQALHAFSRRVALAWMILFALVTMGTMVGGMIWADGIGLGMIQLAGAIFLVSYDVLYRRTRSDQQASQALLAELVQAHEQLQQHAARAEELAATRERTRLAREIHDSVSQIILSIRLTARAARLLLDRDPARVPEQLDRLQEMTGSALAQLRSLIAQLHPPQHP